MKKKLVLFTAVTALISIAQMKDDNIKNSANAESSPTFLVAPKITKGDEVIFATLGYSSSEFTGGYMLAKDNEKGNTSKAVAFTENNVFGNSDNVFTVVEGSEPNSLAFKLGNQYLRADNSTLKFKETNSDLTATVDPMEASCVLTYPYDFNGTQIDLDITFISDGEDWMVNMVYGEDGDDGCICYEGLGIELEGDSFTIDSLTYYSFSGPSVKVPDLTLSYSINDLTISIPNPKQEVETVDKEASWIYEYDKTLGVSYVKSCLNDRYLYYDDSAAKFKMSEAQNGIDVFYDVSKNTSIHTPTSISINTESLSLEVTQDGEWGWTSIEVTAYYTNGIFTTLPIGGFNIELPDTSVVGTQTVKVSIYNLEQTFDITVKEKPVPEIKITSLSFDNYQTEYYVGDEFNYDVDITVHYSGKEDYLLTKEDKQERVTFSIPNMNNSGHRAVQVGYWEMINGKKEEIKIGQGANYYVDIFEIDYELDSITASLKDNVTLFDSDVFNKNNVEVLATYKAENHNDKIEAVTNFTVTSDFDLTSTMVVGAHNFEVSYTEDDKTVTCSFSATVEHKPVLTGYEVTASDGFVGTEYDASKNVSVLRVYDTGDKEPAENVTVNINDLNAIKASKIPQEQQIRINADGKEVATKTINLIFAPVNSFSLKYESSKEGAKIGDTQQLYIKKVNNEPSLENKDWLSPLSERSEKYLERFTFTSKNTAIATVDEKGFVTYVGNGATEIEVSPKNGDAKPFNYSVLVGGPYPESISFSSNNVKLKIGDSIELEYNILPSTANLSGISWESSDESVATVDASGKVYGVAEGVATITVSDSFFGKSADCTVTVKKAFPTAITLNETSKELVVDEEFILTAVITPVDDVEQKVTFASNNNGVATVDSNGKVKAVGKGSTTIVVTCVEDTSISTVFNVTVVEPIISVSNISLDKTSLALKVNETSKINATISPTDATNKEVTFESDDSSIVGVDEEGNIVALKEGTATITVSSVFDSTKTATCVVTVEAKVIEDPIDDNPVENEPIEEQSENDTPTKNDELNDNNGADENDDSKGCSANMLTCSLLVSSLSFIGLLILLKKKNEFNA